LITIEVDNKGFLKITNNGSFLVKIWKIEFTYYIYTQPLKKEEEERGGRRYISESIDKTFEVGPGESMRYYIKLPPEVIKEVIVYYEEGGSFKKSYIRLNP
jgi:hypothetical protein